MTIEINQEDQELIQRRLQSGVYKNIDEVIHDALASQEAEETWLRENKGRIGEKLERGLDQFSQGRGMTGETARARLLERKDEFLKKQHGE